jgi:hypothetical protein
MLGCCCHRARSKKSFHPLLAVYSTKVKTPQKLKT